MLGFLSDIVQGIEDLPTIIMAGVYDVLNGAFAALAAFLGIIFTALHDVAPLPNPPNFAGAGAWVGWMNWVFPVGEIALAVASMMGMYVGWLALKWAFQFMQNGGDGV